MKTTVLRNSLKEGLSTTERAVAKSSTLPILGNILLSAEGAVLELAATDLEIGIRWRMLAKNTKPGRVVVPPRVLSQLLALLSDQSVDLQTTASQLVLQSSEHTTTIKTLDPEEFPVIPSPKEGDSFFEIDVPLLCQGLSQVVGVVGQSQARPEISGVFFCLQGKTLRLVATDSFRLAERTITVAGSVPKEWTCILPQKTARELTSILGEKEGKVRLYASPTQVVFEYKNEDDPAQPHVQIISRLIDGEYPQYQEVLPKDYKMRAVLDRAEFLNRIKAASLFAGKSNEVRVLVDEEQKGVEVSSRSQDLGENASFLAGEITGKDQAAASFNWRFLAEGLSSIREQNVQLGFNGDEGPAALMPSPAGEFLYIVMPIKA
ncbi:MAG: DNA polymerase III subunit beta [Candidatus Yanofskybacteria bacterium]|nr:DNA polymerase III subunit beta [Candidatus Yanofskybacteria bacterium]